MQAQYAAVPAMFSLKGWLLILTGDSVIAMQEVRLGERAHRQGSLYSASGGYWWGSPGFPGCTHRGGVGEDTCPRAVFQ